ncbi:MAG: alpha amylase family protein [Armatimonadota bacterium]
MRYALLLIGLSLMWVSSGAAASSKLNSLCREKGLQGRVIWFDAEANMQELSTREGVAETVRKCRSANINTIIVDVKPLAGLVLYNSKIAPKLVSLDGKAYPRGYDLLKVVVEEGHKAGIAVHAAINVFSEGSQTMSGGPAFRHPDWQCVQFEMDRTVSASGGEKMALRSADGPYPGGMCVYGRNSYVMGDLPPGSVYVSVSSSGRVVHAEQVAGQARLSAPEGGFLLIGNNDSGAWLKQLADGGARFKLEGKSALRRVGETDNLHHAVFVNPCNPEVRAYELSLMREICRNYAVDGIVLDRMRYPNLYTDFSDVTRTAFEEFIGKKVENWPGDVFTRPLVPGDELARGPLFKEWIKFRAKVIRDFLAEAKHTVKSVRPSVQLGVYVGSWYPVYFDVGVNWGSPSHSAPDLDWWPDGYEETGYADLADYLCTGCYYTHPTRKEALAKGDVEWKSVEAAAEESINAVGDETFIYGSLYLRQYRGRPKKFLEAIRQCLSKTQGCMLFDLVYVRDYDWWSVLKQAFPKPANAPHKAPAMLGKRRNGNS